MFAKGFKIIEMVMVLLVMYGLATVGQPLVQHLIGKAKSVQAINGIRPAVLHLVGYHDDNGSFERIDQLRMEKGFVTADGQPTAAFLPPVDDLTWEVVREDRDTLVIYWQINDGITAYHGGYRLAIVDHGGQSVIQAEVLDLENRIDFKLSF